MSEEIINRVANSKLITLDLEDLYPSGDRVLIDIKGWLFEDLILKEADFRTSINEHDWQQYNQKYVALTCSSEAIIPSWAYMLISTKLTGIAKKIVVGNFEILETAIFQELIANMDVSAFAGKPIILKGCAIKPIPQSAYTLLIEKLVPIVSNLMFGEACSTVPLYKVKK